MNAPLFFADQEYAVDYSLQNMEGKQVISVRKEGVKNLPGLALDLKGAYQKKNLPVVLKTIEILRAKGWNIK